MGRPAKDETGQKFGKLTVVSRHIDLENTNEAMWNCLCDCGKEHVASGQHLRRGMVKSCGCLLKDLMTTHGLSDTPEYNIWRHVKDRCRNNHNGNFKRYGGRGITMCDDWYFNFHNFYRDMGPRPGEGYSIERKDNEKGYYKENCKWATKTEQANNRSTNVFYTYKGVSRTISGWCRELKLDEALVRCRMNQSGWSFEKAITTPKLK